MPGFFKAWALSPGKAVTQYKLDLWKSEWGLPQSTIYAILQSRDGYIWIGTRDGLICFDGVRFRIFNAENLKYINNNYIRALYEDREGRLWIGAGETVACLHNGRFTHYSTVKDKDSTSNYIVSSITGDRNGNLWVGTLGSGVFYLNTNKKYDPFRNLTTNEGLSHNEIYQITEDSEGRLWIATLKGLDTLKNGTFLRFPLNDMLKGAEVYAVFEDSRKNLWVGTQNGLIKFSNGKICTYTTRNGLSHNTVLKIFEDNRGNLWIGTEGGGLNRMQGDTFSALTYDQGLSDNFILSIEEDKEGSLWVGTASGGLNRLKDTNFINYSTREGLSNDMISCIHEGREGNLWIGTSNGLNLLINGKLTTFTTTDSLSSNTITAFYEDPRGNFWIGTNKGPNLIIKSAGKARAGFSVIKTKIETQLKSRYISCISGDRNGNTWIGAVNGDLYRFNKDRLTTIAAGDRSMNYKITCILETGDGGIWIGTDGGGLYRLAVDTLSRTHYSTGNGLSCKCVLCLHKEDDGTLWIGTYYGGLHRFKDGKFVSFMKNGGFFNFEIHNILDDGNGDFWITSNKGVFRVNKKQLDDFADGRIDVIQPLAYNETDGMASRICNGGHQPAGCKSRDGRLWFPTISGVSMIDPGKIMRNTLPPPVIIEEIIVDNIKVKSFFEPLNGDSVTFSPGKKNFEFHYTGLSYLWPQKVNFKYKLDGYDIEWKDAGTRRTAYYTNVEPGHYTFRVAACNNDGMWNNNAATFDFYLAPYFYQTPWFYFLCAIVLGVVIRSFISMRITQLKNHKIELQQLVEERTRMLEVANRELSKLATLDGLTGIYNYRWFINYLEREWKRAIRNSAPLSILLIDVDFFKLYNDTYGHQAGDECLRKIAAKLKDNCRRPGDAVARYGGEEFIVLLPDTGAQDASLVAEMMREGAENICIPHEHSSVKNTITISVGYAALTPQQDDDPTLLIKKADEALYIAKQMGRNCCASRDGNVF